MICGAVTIAPVIRIRGRVPAQNFRILLPFPAAEDAAHTGSVWRCCAIGPVPIWGTTWLCRGERGS